MKRLIALSGVSAALLVASAPAFAFGDIFNYLQDQRNRRVESQERIGAPEIDVSSGTKGIAILVAGLLLVGEGLRRRS